MISYVRAKLAWLEAGGKAPEPNFTDYEHAPPSRTQAAGEARRRNGDRAAILVPIRRHLKGAG